MGDCSDGFKQLTGGVWNGSDSLSVQGGQGMRFVLQNTNVLGTTITISSSTGESHSLILPPLVSMNMDFSTFGREPMGWSFSISTDSDAFIVAWTLCSTWVPGDPPNG